MCHTMSSKRFDKLIVITSPNILIAYETIPIILFLKLILLLSETTVDFLVKQKHWREGTDCLFSSNCKTVRLKIVYFSCKYIRFETFLSGVRNSWKTEC